MYKDTPLSLLRAHQRFNVDTQATLVLDKDQSHSVILKDISAGGAGVLTQFPVEKRKEVGVIAEDGFFFPEPVNKKGRVAWCKELGDNSWQLGIDFGPGNLIHFL